MQYAMSTFSQCFFQFEVVSMSMSRSVLRGPNATSNPYQVPSFNPIWSHPKVQSEAPMSTSMPNAKSHKVITHNRPAHMYITMPLN